jgi:hypothetical protein
MENLCTLLELPPVHALLKNGGTVYGNAVREALAGTPMVPYLTQAPVVGSLPRRLQPILDRDVYDLVVSSRRLEARSDYMTIEYRLRVEEPRLECTMLVHFLSEFRILDSASHGTRVDCDVNLVAVTREGLQLRRLPPSLVSHPAPLTQVLKNIARRRCVVVAEPRSESEERWLLERRESLRRRGWSSLGAAVEALTEAPEEPDCAICLGCGVEDNETWIRLRACRHVFHQCCWLDHVRSSIGRQSVYPRTVACPLCRGSIAYCDM